METAVIGRSASLLALSALAVALPSRASTVGVVAAGLGGTPEYSESFVRDATTIARSLRSLDPAEGSIELLGASAAGDAAAVDEARADAATASEAAAAGGAEAGGAEAGKAEAGEAVAGGVADRASILTAIERLGARDADTFVLVLLGHGNVDGRSWKFNVAGPDPTGDDLIAALATVRAPRQLIVLGASASGALLETLAQPGRVVVTATKSGGEINAVRFPAYLAEALASDTADLDRNEILTVAEAFRFANARTREYYEQANLLASEHARLLGDEAVSLAVARLGSLALAGDDPAVAALLDTRLVLERDYRALIARKAEMGTDDYYEELETLMLSIAGLQRAIDRTSGWSDDDADS